MTPACAAPCGVVHGPRCTIRSHRVTAEIIESYPTVRAGPTLANRIRAILGRGGPDWELVEGAERPPQEAVKRITRVQRMLLLAQFLVNRLPARSRQSARTKSAQAS